MADNADIPSNQDNGQLSSKPLPPTKEFMQNLEEKRKQNVTPSPNLKETPDYRDITEQAKEDAVDKEISDINATLKSSAEMLKNIAKALSANGVGKAIEPRDSEADKGDKSSASSGKGDDSKSYGAQQDIARVYDLLKNTLHGDIKSIAGSFFQTFLHNLGDAKKMGELMFPGYVGKVFGNVFGGPSSTSSIAAYIRELISIGKTIVGWGVLFITIAKAINAIARSQADFRKSLIESTGGINSPILMSEMSNAQITGYLKGDVYTMYRDMWEGVTERGGFFRKTADNPALGIDEAMKAMSEVTKTLPTKFMGFMANLDELNYSNRQKARDYMMAGDALSRMKAMNPSASSAIDQAFSFLMRKDATISNPLTAIGNIFAAQTASADSALTMDEFMSNLNTMNNDFRLLGGTTLGNVALLKRFGDEINAGTISVSDFAKGARSLHDNSLEKNVAMGAMAVDYAMRRGMALPKDFRDTTAIGRAFYLSSSEAMKGGSGEQVKNILSSAIGAIAEQMGGFGTDKMTNLGMIQMAYEKLYGIKLSSDFLASKNIADSSGRLTPAGESAIWMLQKDLAKDRKRILMEAGIDPDNPRSMGELQAKQAVFSITTTTQLDRIINFLKILVDSVLTVIGSYIFRVYGIDNKTVQTLRTDFEKAQKERMPSSNAKKS